MPKPNVDVGRNRRIRTIETEERIVEMIEQNPTISTRAIGRELDINHITVYKVLKSELLIVYGQLWGVKTNPLHAATGARGMA